MDITGLIDKIRRVVATHRLEEGVYCRWLWQNAQGDRALGVNEYGCADAANILYSIGDFPQAPESRAQWVRALQGQQNPQTGLYTEATHHTIHTTAHCLAALELFDAQPLHPLAALLPYLDEEKLHAFLAGLNWEGNPWPQSHQGAGLYAAMVITRGSNPQWEDAYFRWLRAHADPVTGIGLQGRRGDASLAHQLFGWFHYLFNHEYARQPIPYPERLIDSCIAMYQAQRLDDVFGREVGFREIDWVFCMNRASRQTAHRFDEVKALLWDFARPFIAYLDALAPDDDALNDLHMLFGAVCALAELQLALPGRIKTSVPLKNVLDRRPFI